MEVKSIRYIVEYYARTNWDNYYSERRPCDSENEALVFIQELSKNPRVGKVFYTITKEISFERGE